MKLREYTTGGFDRGQPGWFEALWVVVKCLFFLNPVPWPSELRVALLRAFGAKIGRGVVIRSQVNVTFPWRLTIGDDVWLGEEVLILSLAPVTLESDICISQRTFLCTGSHQFRGPNFDLVTKPMQFLGYTPMSKTAKAPSDPGRPIVWMPQNVDNSCGGQMWVASDKWGLPRGTMLHTSYGTWTVIPSPSYIETWLPRISSWVTTATPRSSTLASPKRAAD